MLTHRERLMLLNLVPAVGSLQLRRLLEAFGDLDGLWRAPVRDLQRVDGISPALAARVAAARQDEAMLQWELALAHRHGAAILTLDDPEYPASLKTIVDPPLALYVWGTLPAADVPAVAIVGTRRASVYGLQCAEQLGYDLALRGLTVVSGLARGIDAASHRGALHAAGRTIAVLGGGLLRLYPPEHAELAEQIKEEGAILSEYPMETEPHAYNFPRRNRLISGLSLGVVVVEAGQRSGALITADCALEQGREVFAVPGPMRAVTSHGTHQLLKQGAQLVTSVEDILEELRLTPAPKPGNPRRLASPSEAKGVGDGSPDAEGGGAGQEGRETDGTRLPDAERRVFACLREREPRYIDTIAQESGLEPPEVSSLLVQLELKRLIQQLPGKQFVRSRSEGA